MKMILVMVLMVASMVVAQGLGSGGGYGKSERSYGEKKYNKMSKGPQFERLIAKLELNEATEKSVKAILSEFHKKRYLLKLDSEEYKIALKKMIVKDQLNMDKIRVNCNKRGDLWAQMQILKFEKDVEIKKLLTKEQWDRYLMHRIKTMSKDDKKGEKGKGKGKGKGKKRGHGKNR